MEKGKEKEAETGATNQRTAGGEKLDGRLARSERERSAGLGKLRPTMGAS